MIREVLKNPIIRVENIYNIDKTRVILSILGSIKALVPKDNYRNYRGTCIKRITVTIIEYISTDNKYLKLIIIWLANIYRSNWTIFLTPG